MTMTIPAGEMADMVSRAAERVRAGWEPTPKGSYLSTLVSDDHPPLTTGAVDMYLGFYTWLWGTDPPVDEANWVKARLIQDSQTAWVRMDWSVRDAVLSTCVLWDQIRERPEDEQEAIRSFLQEQIKPGSYPELAGRPRAEPATAGNDVENQMTLGAARHETIMQVLQKWPAAPR
jgi:hypothetical protein